MRLLGLLAGAAGGSIAWLFQFDDDDESAPLTQPVVHSPVQVR